MKILNQEWFEQLEEEFKKEYFQDLNNFVKEQRKENIVFPKEEDVFNTFNLTPLSKIKVVILGQDPYHGNNQAHGLAFSVKRNNKIPPSLKNIFKELSSDLDCLVPQSGDLTQWAKEGVFLLNTVLTVRSSEVHSHKAQGWEIFTDKVIELINEKCENVVFILLGAPAQLKAKILNHEKHLILKAPHPSPLSSYRGFFGSKIFSQTNSYLKSHAKEAVQWCLVK